MATNTYLPVSNDPADKERLKSAANARAIVGTLLEANWKRAEFNARIKGMLDGNPPYDPAKLRNNGQANRANFNALGGKAALSSALTPYYDLFSGAKHYLEISTDYGQPQDRQKWSEIITEEADRTLKDWDGFDFNIQTAIHDRLAYGKGFLIPPDRDDWRFEHVYQGRVMVPDGSQATLERVETLVIRQAYRVSQLYNYVRDNKTASKVGWNVQAVVMAIIHAVPVNPFVNETTWNNYEAIQQWIKDKDVLEGARSSTVQCSHIFQKEFSGDISHYIITESPLPSEPPESAYLYRKTNRYKSLRECIWPTFFETLDGSWNGAAGLGRDIYSAVELQNRLICATADAAFLRAGISLQAKSRRAVQDANLIQIGSLNVIPPEFEVQQATVMGDIQGTIAVERFLEQITSSNTGIYRPKMDQPTGNPRTAEEVRLQYQQQAILGNSAVNRFYLELDRLYQEIYRRLSNPNTKDDEAKDFQKRCEKRGVPKLALLKTASVRAYRNIGNGSMFLRQQTIQGMAPWVPMMNEQGKQAFLDDAISATTSYRNVDRYNPKPDKLNTPDDQMALAMSENNSFKTGNPVLVTPTQDHVTHAQVHLQSAATSLQTLEQGAQPEEVAQFIDGAGKHTAQHMAMIHNDPSRQKEYDGIEQQLKQLAQMHDQLVEQIQKNQQQRQEQMQAQQQAQAIGNGIDPDTAIKAAQAQQDMAMKTEKARHQMDLKTATTRQKLALTDATVANKIRNTNRMTQAKENEL